MQKKILEIIVIHLIIIIIICVSEITNYRLCVFYNILGIPCYGCGLTRGILNILNGNILTAIKYNYLSVIIFIAYIVSFVWIMYDLISKKNTFNEFLKSNFKYLIFISIILIVIAQIININNSLLY